MDLEKLYSFVSKTFLGYFDTLIGTLTFGRLQLVQTLQQPVALVASGIAGAASVAASPAPPLIEPDARRDSPLFGYVVLSVIVGMALGSIRTQRLDPTQLVVATIFLSVAWLIYGSVVYGVCRVLGGGGTYRETMAVMIRVLATVYVVASFIALSLYALMLAGERLVGLSTFGDNGVVAYYAAHVVLLIVYIPLSLGPIHRLSRSRTLALAVLPPLLAVFGLAVSLALALPSLIGS